MVKENVYGDFLKTLQHIEPDNIPVCIWNTRCNLVRAPEAKNLMDYYKNTDIKLYSQLFPMDYFKDCLILPGVWPDFGVVLEASAFGCPIVWNENNPPHAKNFINDINEVKKIKSINPETDGLMPAALKEYAYMLKKLDKKYINKIGYLDGCVQVTGPLEVATAMLGHSNFFIAFYSEPDLVKGFLEVVTDGIIRYIKALEKIAGELKIISVIEHVPGMLSADHNKQFAIPYISRIFHEFPRVIGLYHNEDNITHILSEIPKLGADIWHFGEVNPEKIKTTVGEKMTIMGNVHPLRILLEGKPDDVIKACRENIDRFAGGGGYILCSGGGLSPGTPLENVRAMVDTARKNSVDI